MSFKLILNYFRSLIALIMSAFLALSPAGFPRVPHEKDFELVWSDEFEGDALDRTKWKGSDCGFGYATVRRGGYWDAEMATVQDGCLHIRTQYYPEGYNGNGKPGWYTCGIDTAGLYGQRYGYFEIRCILPKGTGMWAAFWMLCHGMGNVNGSGTDGAEIDIMEAPFFGDQYPNRISSNVHYDGYGEGLKSKNVCEAFLLKNDPYEEYNTYGLEWNEKGYIFYVNGIETGRTDFGGASQTPEYILLSVEVGGSDAVPGESWAGQSLTPDSETTDFIVDYVRAYQYK